MLEKNVICYQTGKICDQECLARRRAQEIAKDDTYLTWILDKSVQVGGEKSQLANDASQAVWKFATHQATDEGHPCSNRRDIQ